MSMSNNKKKPIRLEDLKEEDYEKNAQCGSGPSK